MDNLCILVGGIPTPLKKMKVNWDDDIPNIWKNKKCSKPPSSSNSDIGILLGMFPTGPIQQ